MVCLDGGLATELERHGCDLRDPLWSSKVLLEDRAVIERVHRDYLLAGADVIATATYQATSAGFAMHGLDARAGEQVMLDAVMLADRARVATGRSDAAVAGSLGSYGAFLADGSEYRGDYGLSVAELVAFHRPRVTLMAPVVDVVACETVPCLAEAQALAIVLAEIETPAWVSFSCRDEREVCHGEALEVCAAVLADVPSVLAIGVNCVSPRWVNGLARILADSSDKAVMAYPNSGEQYAGVWQGDAITPEAFATLAAGWVSAGVRIVGGCCRTTPAHIRALRG